MKQGSTSRATGTQWKVVRIGQGMSMLIASCFATAAFAQATPLTKAEVETMTGDNKVEYVRASDQATIAWAFKKDGAVFYTTTNTRRNIPIHGTYTISDNGAVCFKWDQDKYLTMTDGCIAFSREGDKIHVTGARDRERILGDVVK